MPEIMSFKPVVEFGEGRPGLCSTVRRALRIRRRKTSLQKDGEFLGKPGSVYDGKD